MTFQSPFHRGNGCNLPTAMADRTAPNAFSPLFIGAMVVTEVSERKSATLTAFQSPFHRGNGCNCASQSLLPSIPRAFSPLFIGATVVTTQYGGFSRRYYAFSPLFIGATVVTQVPQSPLSSVARPFSPLFIGATVVTRISKRLRMKRNRLSVPFSSGQRL